MSDADPSTHFFSVHLYDYSDTIGETIYRKYRRSKVNTMLVLPREIRDMIYDLVLYTDSPTIFRFAHNKPQTKPPPLMRACKQFYCEAKAFYIKSLKVVVDTGERLRQISEWLDGRHGCDGFHCLRDVVFTRIELFCTTSRPNSAKWWKEAKQDPNGVSKIREVDPRWRQYFSDPEGVQVPLGVQFLRHCANVKNLEIGIHLHRFILPHHHFHEFGCLLPAIIQLYDLQVIGSMKALENLTLHLRAANPVPATKNFFCKRFVKGLIKYIEAHIDDTDPTWYEYRDVWGLKSWLTGEFEKAEKKVKVDTNYSEQSLYRV
ncbi:hypothetical protein BCR34DRAFT_582749 [Clohesyomyces aquaticus]|uniref:F-box domain-containing protein n=1 Tax=Clohesyomyces aquaticus TaxID=1231657 RepID=A0A1Y2A8M6_9PLEO|nr:hypothetical protein BCR34DRAFT_582749 [Clohesyomyces aquaticus]